MAEPISMMLMAFAGMQAYGSKKRQMRELGQQLQVGKRMLEIGGELERSELSIRMQEELLASTDQAVSNAEQLREVLATQNVLAGARGVKTGAGSTRAIASSSVSKYTEDERNRKLALKFKDFNIENMKRVSQLNQISSIYGLQSSIQQQRGAVKDAFREKLINLGGGFLSGASGMGGGGGGMAPVVQSQGIDMAKYRSIK